MFEEVPSLATEEIVGPDTLRIVKAANFRAFRSGDGKEFFGFDMGDGSMLAVSHVDDVRSSAQNIGWLASRVDADGKGVVCGTKMTMHDAVVQTLKLPAPFCELPNGRATVEVIARDEVEARSQMAEIVIERTAAPAAAMM